MAVRTATVAISRQRDSVISRVASRMTVEGLNCATAALGCSTARGQPSSAAVLTTTAGGATEVADAGHGRTAITGGLATGRGSTTAAGRMEVTNITAATSATAASPSRTDAEETSR